MIKTTVIQGRQVTEGDVELIRNLLQENPSWNRTKLSRELCRRWNWINSRGRIKDMACRTLLLKLHGSGKIVLPARQGSSSPNRSRNRIIPWVPHSIDPICCGLQQLLPLIIQIVSVGSAENALFRFLVSRYHYLGYGNTVGENLKYLIRDTAGRLVACLLFGSAAWKLQTRDRYIGWDEEARKRNLHLVTNNMRFLIPDWVKVAHLGSHLLAVVGKRISSDWSEKYGHPVWLLESFVNREKYKGTVYRASNWVHVGATTGRSRSDRYSTMKVPVKEVYLYPLSKRFRKELCHG